MGLDLLYKLDEANGTTGVGSVIDSSGNARHGTPLNGVIFGNAGRVNKCAQFDGVNDYIAGPVLGGAAWTLAAWFNPSSVAASNFMILSDGGTSGRHIFYNTTTLHFQVAAGVGMVELVAGSGAVASGKWNHVAMTYDGTNLRGYHNGILVAGPVARSYAASGSALNVGIMADAVNFPFVGFIDEVRAYNTALSPIAIQQLAGKRRSAGRFFQFRHLPAVR